MNNASPGDASCPSLLPSAYPPRRYPPPSTAPSSPVMAASAGSPKPTPCSVSVPLLLPISPSGAIARFVTRWRPWSGSASSVIACGYEDQDDADALRSDPLLKLVCGRLPDEADLASQPTLSRLENAVDAKACYHLALVLVQLYLQERGRDGIPERIVLDFDGTDDPASQRVPERSSARGSHQEGVAYHGYYKQHMLHPLLVFDGDTGQLITTVLRPGTAHASKGALAVLKRLVRRIRARFPQITIELRADSGFAAPAIYDYCEDHQIPYTIGLATNDRLSR
jgi:Transposase DDE domain group 1